MVSINIYLIFLFLINFSFQIDYYVSKTGNDDTNDGKSLSSAFLTISKGAEIASAGDTVYVQNGKYEEEVRFRNSGNEEDGYVNFVADGNSVVVDGYHISYPNTGYAIFLVYHANYTRISGFHVRNSQAYGIRTVYSNNIIIENNVIYNTSCGGIMLSRNYGGDGVPTFGYIVRNNTIDHANTIGSNEAISVSGVHEFEVYDNRILNTFKESLDVKSGSENGVVYGNYICNNYRYFSDDSYHHPSLYIDGFARYVRNVSFFRNTIECKSTAISLATESGGVLEDIFIYENWVNVTESHGMSMGTYEHVQGSHMKRNIVIKNNFISAPDGICLQFVEHGRYLDGFQVKNNVFFKGSLVNNEKSGEGVVIGPEDWDFSMNVYSGKSYVKHRAEYPDNLYFVVENEPLVVDEKLNYRVQYSHKKTMY